MQEFTISNITGRQILDSRGNPTVEADVTLASGVMGRAAVPSGASTGSGEALELRDGDDKAWGGKGVGTAVRNINGPLAELLQGFDASDQKALDKKMIEADGTNNKSRFGANAILAISLAAAKAVAASKNLPLWRYIADMTGSTASLPMPMMNVMNGGAHAAGSTDIQEYMIMPVGAKTIEDTLRIGTEVFHALKKVLSAKGYATTVGDEGGYAPRVTGGNREPLELIKQAVADAGYEFGKDVVLCLDVAASELYDDASGYVLKTEGRTLRSDEMIAFYEDIVNTYPIRSIEDGLDETDWANWTKLTEHLGGRVQLVGDDLLVTNTGLIRDAIGRGAANAVLIKPNQIGSLSETIDAVKMSQEAGFNTVMSHRSGETEDVTIAHLAVGLGCGQIKTGSLSRTDRVAKYNELLRIAESEPSLELANPLG